MWETIRYYILNVAVAPREGRVSRNILSLLYYIAIDSRAP